MEKDKKSIRWETMCFIMLVGGILLRLIYAHEVPYNISTHDLGHVSDWNEPTYGHLGYIQYIYQYHRLPDGYIKQTYHPPLFHVIGAFVMGIFCDAKGNPELSFEMLQYLNTLFSGIASIYIYRCAKELGCSEKAKVVITAFAAFSPTLMWLGTQLNNDCLMTMFSIMAIFYTIKWDRTEKLSDIVKIALTVAFSMLAKTSGGLIAVGIGLVFLLKLIKNIRTPGKVIRQLFIFAVICIPLGLCWLIRCNILYDMPFNYVYRMSTESCQYISDVPVFHRLGLPSYSQLTYVSIDLHNPEFHSNIWAQTVNTLLYDEGLLKHTAMVGVYAEKFFDVLEAITLVVLAGTVIGLCAMKKVELSHKLLLAGVTIVITISYVLFAFKYPFVCTMNGRYLFTGVAASVLAYGIVRDRVRNTKINRCLFSILGGFIIMVNFSVALMYII